MTMVDKILTPQIAAQATGPLPGGIPPPAFPQRHLRMRKQISHFSFALLLLATPIFAWAVGGGEMLPRDSWFAAPLGLLIVLATFWLLMRGGRQRHLVALVGADVLLSLGALLGFYLPPMALGAVGKHIDTLLLIVGMATFSAVLGHAGLFGLISEKLAVWVGDRQRRAAVVLCLATFVLSTVINNLATTLIIIPVTMVLCARSGWQAERIIAVEIVASNLGGAASMIGDFPNMLIAEQTGMGFTAFLTHLGPIALLQLLILMFAVGTTRWIATGVPSTKAAAASPNSIGIGLPLQPEIVGPVAMVLGLTVVAISAVRTLGGSPGWIAVCGAIIAFSYYPHPKRLLPRLCLADALFFASLFILVGGIEAAGILSWLSELYASMSPGRPQLLMLLVSAALTTSVLSAGPTTAFLVPAVAALPMASEGVAWWVLSLGICAGSSATLIGATAGPVSASLSSQYAKGDIRPLTARSYLAVGLVAAPVQLLVGAGYIWLVTH